MQALESVAVTRGNGVDRFIKCGRNFLKCEFAPNAKDDHFTLCFGQTR